MSRTVLMVLAAIAWTAAVADGLIHLAGGDALVPVAMAVAAVGYVAIRLLVIWSRRALERQTSS